MKADDEATDDNVSCGLMTTDGQGIGNEEWQYEKVKFDMVILDRDVVIDLIGCCCDLVPSFLPLRCRKKSKGKIYLSSKSLPRAPGKILKRRPHD